MAIERILRAAPHRGERLDVRELDRLVAGVQSRSDEPRFVGAALHADDRLVVVVTGCVYARESVNAGPAAARALAKAYIAGGIQGLGALRGAYAVVLFDRLAGEAVAFRSPVGERPLFWRSTQSLTVFASEVKQVIAAPLPAPRPSIDALLDTVAMRPEAARRTSYDEVQRLLPGSWIEVRDGAVRGGPTWNPRRAVGRRRVSVDGAAAEFRQALRTAVARRLEPDSAVLLSGGLDSTAVAAAAAPLHESRFGGPLVAISAAYPDQPGADESRYIADVVDALGLARVSVHPRPLPFRDLEAELTLHDGPIVAPLSANIAQILEAARQAGCRAALDGHDGDSLLGGRAGVVRALLRRGALLEIGRHLSFVRRKRGLGWPRMVRSALGALRQPRPQAAQPAWVLEPLAGRLHRPTRSDWYEDQVSPYDGWLALTLETIERTALASGITILHPLTDVDLVELCLSFGPEVKFANGQPKAIARRACLELPASVRGRVDKTNFEEVMLAGAPPDDVMGAIRAGPRVLPGVDWDFLERRAKTPLSAPELRLLLRAVRADHFLARS